MKKTFIFTTLTTFFILSHSCFSQDLITKKNGEVIQTKVLEVGQTEIKYKKFGNQNGPTYTIGKSDVLMIRYENGTKDLFNNQQKSDVDSLNSSNVGPVGQITSISGKYKPFFSVGFDLIMHSGRWGGTVPARPSGGAFNSWGGDPYSGYGYGININYHLMKYITIYYDINTYSLKTPVAYKGGNAESNWVFEMTNYNQKFVGPFNEDLNYSIQTTGMRLGLKIYPARMEKFQPWFGIYYGYYAWMVGIFSADKKHTYGNTSGDTFGSTYLNFGVDMWNKSKTLGATLFFEFGSPVARNYKIDNCLIKGWTFTDSGEGFHLFGYNRVGLSLNFVMNKKNKKPAHNKGS